jgi:hypothetical protein
MASAKYETEYEADVDIVAHEHWVALFLDKKNAQHIRLITKEDAWKYDVQAGMRVLVKIRPANKVKVCKVLERPL